VGSKSTQAGAEQALPAAEMASPHDHRWSGVAFFLEDDHPWFRVRCACGAERTIRAWERYSEPGPDTDAPDNDVREATTDG
jgi:hypothetical protein